MRADLPRRTLLAALALLCFGASGATAAAHDNIVEWGGLSHITWQDRVPSCPVDPSGCVLTFQSLHDDLTSADLMTGPSGSMIRAALQGVRGPYDVWQVTLPGTETSYWFRLTDGSTVAYLSASGVSSGVPVDGGFVLNYTTLEHAPVGISSGGTSTIFKVWSPTTTSARVRGDFNGWGAGLVMNRVGEYWIGRTNTVADRSSYKYYFNNATWNTDPRARSLDAANGPYNAVIEWPARYNWRVTDFQTPPLEDMVVYQLHIGTYAGRNDPLGAASNPGTYLDVAKRIGHLADLGVNAVMINPVTEFPGDLSAGYNPITQWSPEWKYGTPDQFKVLVDSLHVHGIAVILDIVWNHFSSSDNFLWNYDGTQQWFDTPAVDTPWGSQTDFDKLAVRDYYADAALMWLKDYRLDGFRMDATSYMNISPQAAAGWGLMQRLNNEIDNRYVDKVAIAEQLPTDAAITKPVSLGGAGFDAQYNMQFRDALRNALFSGPTGDPSMSAVRSALYGNGAYLNGRSVFNYFQLHDEAWPTSGGQRLVKTLDGSFPYDTSTVQARMKLALGLTLLSPGVPAMLMGDEWLEDTDFGTGTANRIDWSKLTTYTPYYACIQRLILLRRGLDAFRANRPINVLHFNESGNVVGFTRTNAVGQSFLVMANFGNTSYPIYRIGAPTAGGWSQLINTEAAIYGGSGPDNGALATEAVPYDGQAQSLVVSLPPRSILVFAPAAAVGVDSRPTVSSSRITRLAPVPAREGAAIEFSLAEAGTASVEVLDVTGRRVVLVAHGTMGAGAHALRWEGRDESGRAAPAGIYFVRLITAWGTDVHRLPLLR